MTVPTVNIYTPECEVRENESDHWVAWHDNGYYIGRRLRCDTPTSNDDGQLEVTRGVYCEVLSKFVSIE